MERDIGSDLPSPRLCWIKAARMIILLTTGLWLLLIVAFRF